MKRMINIDGFEFEATCSDVSDVENLNYFLEDKFNKFDVKNFMSGLHPELFPNHVGLLSDDNLMLRVVLWEKGYLSLEGRGITHGKAPHWRILRSILPTFSDSMRKTSRRSSILLKTGLSDDD